MKKFTSLFLSLLLALLMFLSTVSADVVGGLKLQIDKVLLNTAEYEIDGKIVVFNMYNDNGNLYDAVDVYTDETKQERAKVDSELATKIDEILIARLDISDKYMPTSSKRVERGGTARAIGETLSNSAAGTGLGECKNTYVGHNTKRDKYEESYYMCSYFYNGSLRIIYNGEAELISMKLEEYIRRFNTNVEVNYPSNYAVYNNDEYARINYTWNSNEVGYLRSLNRNEFDTKYLSEADTVIVNTVAYVTCGNETATATVYSQW